MTTWAREQGGSGDIGLLRGLQRAVVPFIEAAGRSDDPRLVRVRTGDPMTVDVVWADARTYRAVGTGAVGNALAHAAGEFLAGALTRQPEDARHALAPLMAHGSLVVELDQLLGSATGSLEVEGNPPVLLFQFHEGDVH